MKMIQETIPLPTNAAVESMGDSVKAHPAKFRFIRAFDGTLRIAINPVFFHLMGKFRGAEWENSRMSVVYGRNARRLKRFS